VEPAGEVAHGVQQALMDRYGSDPKPKKT